MTSSIAAVVEGGQVTNMIVVGLDDEGNSSFQQEGAEIVLLSEDTPVAIGWSYENGDFQAPPQEDSPTLDSEGTEVLTDGPVEHIQPPE